MQLPKNYPATFYMTMERFKEEVETTSITIKKNPKTGKLFAVSDSGQVFRVQATLDFEEEVEWIVKGGDVENATLVNVGRGAATLATF